MIVAATLASWAAAIGDSQREADLQTRQLQATAAVIAAVGAEATHAADRPGAQAALRAAIAAPEVTYARIEARDGTLLAEIGPGGRRDRAAEIADRLAIPLLDMLRSRTVDATAPVTWAGQSVGRVVMLGQGSGIGARLWSSLWVALGAALVALGPAFWLASRVGRALSSPMVELSRTMARIEANHDIRLRSDIATQDEIGDLAQGLNAMLEAMRAAGGTVAKGPAPTSDPGELAEMATARFWTQAKAKGLDLAAYVDPGVPRKVVADAQGLSQVMDRLIANAVAFTETGAVFVEITSLRPGRLRLAVHDTGAGLAKDRLDDLFSAEGRGLPICKRQVEAMGGQMMARSEPGRGSVFGFEVPIEIIAPAEPMAARAGTFAVSLAAPATRSALKRYLAKAGFRPAGEAEAADLTFCDVNGIGRVTTGSVIRVGAPGAGPSGAVGADAVLAQPLRRRDLERLLAACGSPARAYPANRAA